LSTVPQNARQAKLRRAFLTTTQHNTTQHNSDLYLSSITMAEAGPDRSSIEIKSLLRKLHPDKGNHKDRIRRLGKFRNYVMGDGVRNVMIA
jgi:hypothetical protein